MRSNQSLSQTPRCDPDLYYIAKKVFIKSATKVKKTENNLEKTGEVKKAKVLEKIFRLCFLAEATI